MRGEEIRMGIDVYPALSAEEKAAGKSESDLQSLGKSRKAATIAIGVAGEFGADFDDEFGGVAVCVGGVSAEGDGEG
ncbi:hypothetical protein V496_05371 [Pseudogymnoascus sp. VKM F-4515 (FW-2607)]|nr:hypothetical protein V496_05371 [Pseudogymnoascus sp. VKM F-4515 (FW-2607)]